MSINIRSGSACSLNHFLAVFRLGSIAKQNQFAVQLPLTIQESIVTVRIILRKKQTALLETLIIKSLQHLLYQEVVRVMNGSQIWKPTMQNVQMTFNQPITFTTYKECLQVNRFKELIYKMNGPAFLFAPIFTGTLMHLFTIDLSCRISV